MIKMICISIIFLLATFAEGFSEVVVPPPPIDIDISNSSFEKIDSTKFRIRDLVAPAYPGSYWVDFLWDRDQLLFQPTGVGEETSSPFGIKVAFVSKNGEHYSDPVAAMNDIASWCGTPSETNPCLVKILPGVYDIGTNTLQMQPYVDIEGSGEKVTKIRGNVGSNDSPDVGVINSANAEIRFVTAENTGGSNYSIAISSYDINTKITNVTIVASGGVVKNYGFYSAYFFMPLPATLLNMTNVTINTSGGSSNYGVYKEHNPMGAYPIKMENVAITSDMGEANYGIYANEGTRINNSTIKAGTVIYNSGGTIGVTNTLIDGLVSGPGTTKCAGVYDENFTFYANTCP